jgi:hypothetical protein
MKIIKKRALAALIDSFIMGTFFVIFQELTKLFEFSIGNWDLLLLIPFFCRDFTFRNASIGKKILGIAVYDEKWKYPSLKKIFVRSIVISTAGYVIFFKFKFIDGNLIQFLDWERDKLGTRVVDKKVFKRLSQESESYGGDFSKNMTELYHEYLRNLYY